jgi:AraC-like DNA-binding protein
VKNKSFKQYITELKIEYLIKKLKLDKNYRKYTIKYLAEEIGYTSASAFTRAFKKHKGIIPSEFIKSLSEED